jgi:chromosome segregation ATPase
MVIMKCAKTLFIVFCALLAAGSAGAQKLYKYVDENGRTRYTDRPPIDMTGRASEQLNSQGTVVKRNAAALTPEEIAAQEEQKRKEREAAAIAREENRKNRALLATYPSIKDIDDARARALANNAESTRQIKLRIAELEKRRTRLQKESEPYKDKTLPSELKREAFEVESDLRAQHTLLEAKQKEVEGINARYDEDKSRYLRITGASAEPSASVATKAAP